jgi:hypothetical protein
MTEKTGQPMYIDTLDTAHPERVLLHISLDYSGFRAVFDLPGKRKLGIDIAAFVKKSGVIEVYEHLKGSEPGRYWLVKSNRYEVDGTDPLPLLAAYLKTTLGGIEHGYEDSFAETVLAGIRSERKDEQEP